MPPWLAVRKIKVVERGIGDLKAGGRETEATPSPLLQQLVIVVTDKPAATFDSDHLLSGPTSESLPLW